MSFFILVKIIHILCAIFFIGVVGFRTFILPAAQGKLDKDLQEKVMSAIGFRARSIIKINNVFLILSGLYLFHSYSAEFNLLLLIKAFLGLVVASLFYFAPFFIKKYKYFPWFNKAFHHSFFSLMILIVVLSQIVFI